MLKVENLEAAYGSIVALRGVSIEVKQGDCVAIIGSNGVGKTTMMRTIMGLMQPKNGTVLYRGQNITRWPTDKKVEAGITLVPEGRQIFSELTVLENLKMGAFSRNDNYTQEIKDAFRMFPRLEERANQKGGSLSGGEQQMLALARALMSKPKMLLLDEPSMGLAPVIVNEIFATIRRLNQEGMTIMFVEQNAKIALKTANKAYVMENGRVVLEGTAEELANNDKVREIYLGN